MDPKRTPCPELHAAIESTFGVSIHPAEMGMIYTGEEMAELLLVKIDAVGKGKQWSSRHIWLTLRDVIAEVYGDWATDILQHHPIRRDEYRAVFDRI